MTFDPAKLSVEERVKLKENIADLRRKFELFTRRDNLEVGDIVSWKPGLTNRRYPRPGTAGIITRIFPVPARDESKTETSSPYFGEELTACVGILDNDGDFVEFAYDMQRLQRIDLSELVGKHSGYLCDSCNAQDFGGVRFHCLECDNFDLCADCHADKAEPQAHSHTHKMDAIEPCTAALLRERLALFQEVTCFQPGDLVQWKVGLKNKRLPKKEELAVVVETLPAPITDEDKGSSGSYFLEPLDLRLGLVDEDDDFVIFHYDSRRFTKAM
jgi:hypothetical protein